MQNKKPIRSFIITLFIITLSQYLVFPANNFLKFDKDINGSVKTKTEILYFDIRSYKFQKDNYPIKSILIFNKDKIRTEEIKYKNNNILDYKEIYIYDEYNNIKFIEKYVDNNLLKTTKFFYDKYDNCIEASTYNNKNELLYKFTGVFFKIE